MSKEHQEVLQKLDKQIENLQKRGGAIQMQHRVLRWAIVHGDKLDHGMRESLMQAMDEEVAKFPLGE